MFRCIHFKRESDVITVAVVSKHQSSHSHFGLRTPVQRNIYGSIQSQCGVSLRGDSFNFCWTVNGNDTVPMVQSI